MVEGNTVINTNMVEVDTLRNKKHVRREYHKKQKTCEKWIS